MAGRAEYTVSQGERHCGSPTTAGIRPAAGAAALRRVLLSAFAALLLAAGPAHAFRCGSRIVSQGDHYTKVLKICGEPIGVQERVIYREGRTRPRVRVEGPNGIRIEEEVLQYDRSYVEIVVEEWTYNFGPRRLMQLVRFENGFVVDVDQLGYGFRE